MSVVALLSLLVGALLCRNLRFVRTIHVLMYFVMSFAGLFALGAAVQDHYLPAILFVLFWLGLLNGFMWVMALEVREQQGVLIFRTLFRRVSLRRGEFKVTRRENFNWGLFMALRGEKTPVVYHVNGGWRRWFRVEPLADGPLELISEYASEVRDGFPI